MKAKKWGKDQKTPLCLFRQTIFALIAPPDFYQKTWKYILYCFKISILTTQGVLMLEIWLFSYVYVVCAIFTVLGT